MKEEWKDIKGFESYYQISSLGSVRSKERRVQYKNGKFATHKYRKRKPSLSEYRMIALSKENKIRLLKISRLVAKHFIPNPFNKPVVNHIDGDKYNDIVSNLEWSTYSENSIHAFNVGLNKKKNKVSGVFYDPKRKKWASYLYRDCKNIFIGRFNTEEEAIIKRQIKLDDYNKS